MPSNELPEQRKLIWLGNEQMQIAVAQGGGHIAALRLLEHPEIPNPFWKPPWRSLEPEDVTDDIVERGYGGPPEGRLLASILGHSLALDLYGAPSQEETAAGLVTHGTAGVLPWQWEYSARETLIGRCEDHIGQMRFLRKLHLSGYCVSVEEQVTSLCAWDRAIGWQQHVSFGPPFCEEGFWSDSNCDRGSTHPQSFGEGASLVPGIETQWPHAPRRTGGFCDYRRPLEVDTVANDFTGFQVRSSDQTGYFVAGNTSQGFALFYLWPRQFFPWMGVWDEKHARDQKPWEKQVSVRAYEFGVSPYPLLRRELLSIPQLFDLPTYLMLPARGTLWVRYILGVFAVVNESGEFITFADEATLSKAGKTISRVNLPVACASSERWEMNS